MHKMYRIVRTTGTLDQLARLVEVARQDGWKTSGAPFRDSDAREWCLAMEKDQPPKSPEVKIREPKR